MSNTHQVFARLLWQSLVVGVLLTLLFPAARGTSAVVGPLAFWLLGAPLTGLIVFHRHALRPCPQARRLIFAGGWASRGTVCCTSRLKPGIQPNRGIR